MPQRFEDTAAQRMRPKFIQQAGQLSDLSAGGFALRKGSIQQLSTLRDQLIQPARRCGVRRFTLQFEERLGVAMVVRFDDHTLRTKFVERIDGLFDGHLYIGRRRHCEQAETPGMRLSQPGPFLIHSARELFGLRSSPKCTPGEEMDSTAALICNLSIMVRAASSLHFGIAGIASGCVYS